MQATEGNVKFNLDYSGSEGGLDFENFLARLENFRGHASRMRRRRIQILRRLLRFGDSLIECLRIFTRIILELEYDVNSNLFQMRKLCLRFLIYVMLENFRIDTQHGLCAEKC
jgi:hypothetical protein